MSKEERRIKRATYEKAKQRVQAAREAQKVTKAWEEVIANTPDVYEQHVVAVVICKDGRSRVEIELGRHSTSASSSRHLPEE